MTDTLLFLRWEVRNESFFLLLRESNALKSEKWWPSVGPVLPGGPKLREGLSGRAFA